MSSTTKVNFSNSSAAIGGSSTESFIIKAREFMTHGFRILPIILGSFAFIMGIGQGNMAFFFLFLGVSLVVPIINMIANYGFGALFSTFLSENLYKIQGTGEGCSIFGSFANSGDTISVWLAVLVFFVSYFFRNAYNLYNRPAQKGSPDYKIDARKTQALMAMVIILLFGISMLLYRFFVSIGCETPLGIPLAFGIYIPVAYYWYELLVSCSGDRLTDLFGIANRIMVEPANSSSGAVCLPVA
jgi:hypothetical protein